MTGFFLDLRHSFRSLRKTPAIFAVSLVTIALGVGANTAMFSVVNAVLLNPLPYHAPDRLVAPWPEKRWSVGMVRDVEERVASFEGISASTIESYTLLGDQPAEHVQVTLAMPSHFDVLGVRPLLGSSFEPGDATGERGPVVVLSHGSWQRRFGGRDDVIGTVIRLSGHGIVERTVVGVLPPDFWPSTPEAWIPIVTTPDRPGFYSAYGLDAVARLKPGVTPAQATQELRGLVDTLTPLHPTQFRPTRYSPVDVVPLLEGMTGAVRAALLIALGAVSFILLIACTNVANLLLARAHTRQREIAVQMALGCSSRRVVRQVLAESLLLGVLGGAAGLTAAVFALPLVTAFVRDQLPRALTIDIDGTVLAFALGASLLAGLIFGAVPAARAVRAAPGTVMRSTAGRGQSQSRSSRRVNDVLVVAQVGLCLVLLVGAGLMLKSLWRLMNVDPGFDPEHVLTLQITVPPGRYDEPADRDQLRRRIEEQVGTLPGVAVAGSTDYLPLGTGWSGVPYMIEGQPPAGEVSQVVSARRVTAGYFEALRIPLVRGRMFGPDDVASSEDVAVLVNQRFARQHWPDGDPIGARILFTSGAPLGTIVGIVADARQLSLALPPAPEIYVPAAQVGWPTNAVLVVRGAGSVPSSVAVIGAVQSVDREIAARNARTMQAVLRNAANNTRFYARLLTAFGGLALLLGLVGVYGVMSYTVARRTGELGVRLALGATGADLLAHVLGRALLPVGVGVIVGAVGAVGVTRVLASLVFEVHVADPWVLGTVATLLLLGAMAAAFIPAVRATRLSPIQAMHAE